MLNVECGIRSVTVRWP